MSYLLNLKIPEGTKCFRTTLSLPAEQAVALNLLAKRLGISQSALIASLLDQALPNLSELANLLPDELPEDDDSIKRLRGKSIDLVLDRVAALLKEK